LVGDGLGAAVGAVVVWLILALVAFALGAARELWLRPRIGEPMAHRIGTLCACIAFGVIAFLATRHLEYTRLQGVLVGAGWAAGGIGFDYAMVCLVQRRPFADFARDYRLDRGRLTPLLWLTLVVVPWFAA
jgi:hypothetical protein